MRSKRTCEQTRCARVEWRRRIRQPVGAVLLGTLAVIGSGCFRSDVSYVLHDDRSGSVTHSTTIELPALTAGDSTNGETSTTPTCERVLADSRDDRSSAAIFGTLDPAVETTNDGAECSETLHASWTSDEFQEVVEAIAESGGARITKRRNGPWDFRLEWPPEGAEIWQRNTYEADEEGGTSPRLGISVDLPPGDTTTHNSTDLIIAGLNMGASGNADAADTSEYLAVLGGPFTWERSFAVAGSESGSSHSGMFAQTYPHSTVPAAEDILGAIGIGAVIIAALMLPFVSRWRAARTAKSGDEPSFPQPVSGPHP